MSPAPARWIRFLVVMLEATAILTVPAWQVVQPSDLVAQEGLEKESPDRLVARMLSDGTIRFSWSHVRIDDCPPGNPRAVTLIDLALQTSLPTRAVALLATIWTDALADCGYAPLEAWYVSALRQIASDEVASVQRFTMMLPDRLPQSLRHAVREQALEGSLPAGTQAVMLNRSVAGLPIQQRVRTSLELVEAGRVPDYWLANETRLLLRMDAPAFLGALNQSAPRIEARRLARIASVIGSELRAGRVDSESTEVASLRASLQDAEVVGRVVARWPGSRDRP